jgi:DNA-directed RNA polymerase specialized sigma24 family protein
VVARRLLDHAGLTPPPRRLSAAHQRVRATDQHLAERAAQLGFASLQAYLVDRVTRHGWPLIQVASELGVDRDTVRDRLDRFGLRRIRQERTPTGRHSSGG